MPTPQLPESMLVQALNLVEEYGSPYLAAKAGCGQIDRIIEIKQ